MVKTKKLFAAILTLCMIAQLFAVAITVNAAADVWDGTVATAYASGTGTEADPYVITTGAELAYMAQQVNSGVDTAAYFKLGADIDLNNIEWTPIGKYVNNSSGYTGTFDGAGHSVSNLTITGTADRVGLFGFTCAKNEVAGEIKNLTVTNVNVSGTNYVGGIVGNGFVTNFTNCHVNGTIKLYAARSYVGGIVGHMYGKITDCSVKGTADNMGVIQNNPNAGGYVGGIAGQTGEGNNTINGCTVEYVNFIGDAMGGICGMAHSGSKIENNAVKNITMDTTNGSKGYNGLITGDNRGTALKPSYVINNTVENATATNPDGTVLTDIAGKGASNGNTVVGTDVVLDENNKVVSGNLIYIPDAFVSENSELTKNEDGSFSVAAPSVAWDGSVATAYASGTGTEADPYVITTGAELAYMAAQVNAKNDATAYFKLGADIDLNNKEWTPIGNASANSFNGTFDGNGFTVSNLSITTGINFAGLFGRVGQNEGGYVGTVKNVIINNANIVGNYYAGAVTGVAQVATIENCDVTGVLNVSGYTHVGGVIGNGVGTIKNCDVYAKINVTGYAYIGGIAGNGYFTISNCTVDGISNATSSVETTASYVGGVAGFTGEGTPARAISNCSAKNLTLTGVDTTGGIAGIAHSNIIVKDSDVENLIIKTTGTDGTIGAIAGTVQGNDTQPTVLANNDIVNVTVNGDAPTTETSGKNNNGVDNDNYFVGTDVVFDENNKIVSGNFTVFNENIASTVLAADAEYDAETGSVVTKTYVAEVDGVKYETLQAAIDATTESTVTLLADIQLNETVIIPENKNITLDLAGKAITVTKSGDRSLYAIDNQGTFTLTDSVGNGSITARGVKNNGTMVMNAGTINTCDTNGGYGIWNFRNLTMNGGTLNTTYVGNYTQGAAPTNMCIEPGATALITGGTIKSADVGVYAIISNGTLEITPENDGDVIVYGPRGVAVNCGTTTINGGTFTTYNANEVNGTYVAYEVYYPLYVAEDDANVVVNGGVFSVESTENVPTYAICVGSVENATVTSSVKINGGTFNEPLQSKGTTEANGIAISGGTYSEAPEERFFAEGYGAVQKGDGTFGVEEVNYIVEANGVKYETLEEAFANTTEGTITLLADTAGNGIVVPSGSDIILDLGGFTYTVDGETVGSANTKTNAFQLLKNSNITIKNGTIQSEKAKMIIQSYANLTLDNVDLIGGEITQYVLSNNFGTTTITGGTTITATEGNIAFDAGAGWSATYPNVKVIVENATIVGKIELGNYGTDAENIVIDIQGGDLTAAEITVFGENGGTVTKADTVEVTAPEGYEWVNGTLTEIVEDDGYRAELEITRKNVTFESDYSMLFAITPEIKEAYSELYIVAEKTLYNDDEKAETPEIVTLTECEPNGPYYSFTYSDFAAKEMASEVKAVLYAKDAEGNVYYGPTLTYSLREYALNQIRKDTTKASFKTMMVDFLNYGATAQNYFGYNTADLANKDLTAAELALATPERELVNSRVAVADSSKAANITAFNLIFEGKITVLAATTINEATYEANKDNWTIKVSYEGAEEGIEIPLNDEARFKLNGNVYCLFFDELVAKEMGKIITITIYDESGNAVSNTATYSIESYAANKATTGTELLKPLVKNMIKFGDAAAVYFGGDAPVVSAPTQEKLNDAIANAEGSATVELSAGTYTMPTASMANKDITFSGTEDTVIDLTTITTNTTNANVTFDGVTVEFDNDNYEGLTHTNKVVYKDCTIKGKQFLYAENVEFIRCTFENKNDYCVWTYGSSNVTFTDCTFNTGGKAILVYNEQTTSSFVANITLNNCVFNDDDTLDTVKGAVETGTNGGNTETSNKYNITFNKCTVNGFAVNDEGISTDSTFWGNKNSMDADHLTVVVNN